MMQLSKAAVKKQSPYSAAMTRDQYLFYEVRTTAKLIYEGLNEEEVIERIVSENLYQYPTEKSLRRTALACLKRLRALEDEALIHAIATESAEVAKQISLYAMMKHYRIVWDFMVTVIGEKYRVGNTSFGKMDVNVFFMRLQEQDDFVATWSDSTIKKLKQVLTKTLVDNDYIDSTKAETLNPVMISPLLQEGIRRNHDEAALIAFNCFM